MRVLSLFSGGGLGDYGLTLAGMEIVAQVEIDEYCQKILSLRWPEVPKWRDIRDVRGEEVIERCGTVDLISGGFPCQDVSAGGSREGLDGEQSGLWSEMFRIIGMVRPKWVVVENVATILFRGMGTVLAELSSIGYDTEWETFSSRSFGANHNRMRMYFVAYPTSERLARRIFTKTAWEIREKTTGCFEWGNESKVLRKDDGNTTRIQQSKLIGNGIFVPAIEWIGKQIMKFDKEGVK